MTQVTKPIWVIIFKGDVTGHRTEWVAADSLLELLSFYTENGKRKMEKIEKTNNTVTYFY